MSLGAMVRAGLATLPRPRKIAERTTRRGESGALCLPMVQARDTAQGPRTRREPQEDLMAAWTWSMRRMR